MVYYYKVAALTLREYIANIEQSDFKTVSASIGRIMFQNRNWVRDDVDYPEAVETAEMLAYSNKDWSVDHTRCDGERWITDGCLRRIMADCQHQDGDVVGVITTIINHSPYPDADYMD